MKKLLFTLTFFAAMSSVYGSVPSAAGKVTLKVDSEHVQVNLGNTELSEGDQVVIYKETCRGPKVQLCHKDAVASGIVSKVLNEKASEIKLDSAVAVQDGFLVEKR
jgi:hypothetical protein